MRANQPLVLLRKTLTVALVGLVMFFASADFSLAKSKSIPKSCSTLGKVQVFAKDRFVCKIVKGKRVWVLVAKPQPPKPQYSIELIQVPSSLSSPGMLVDPLPAVLQDEGRNSSFVVRVTLGGKTAFAAPVSIQLNDPTASIELLSNKTDFLGLARGWLVAGREANLSVKVSIAGTSVTKSFELSRTTEIKRTSGRPVIATFVPPSARNYDSVTVEATPNTSPVGTYYAFANFTNFYTGIQSVWCNGWHLYETVCDSARGSLKGKEGHFSVWNGLNSNGKEVAPVLVSAPPQTRCSPFDHEGNGLMCMVAFDWQDSDRISITMSKIPGAALGYERLRVTGTNLTRKLTQEFAVVDVPGGVKLGDQFAFFNEHYLVASATSCLDIESRSITVNRVAFRTGASTELPASLSVYGNVVSPDATLCENYGYSMTKDGLEIFSGGEGRFISIAPSLQRDAFPDLHSSVLMFREVALGPLGKKP
jgi:hypothetical protein